MTLTTIVRSMLVCFAAGTSGNAAAAGMPIPSREVGGWAVTESTDGLGCFLTRDYDGPGATRLLLGLDGDGANRLTVLNDHWSIAPKDRLRLTFRLSNASFPSHAAIGIVVDGKRGFATRFGRDFPATFARSRTLEIFRGDVPVERLGLQGSDAAVVRLRDCVDAQRGSSATAAGHAERRGAIPLDPFASPTVGERKR